MTNAKKKAELSEEALDQVTGGSEMMSLNFTRVDIDRASDDGKDAQPGSLAPSSSARPKP